MTTMMKKERFATDDRWALRALQVVYRNQTDAEQIIEHNGIGFSGPDAEILISFPAASAARHAFSKAENLLRRKMPSYASQVARAADTTRLMTALSCPRTTQTAYSAETIAA